MYTPNVDYHSSEGQFGLFPPLDIGNNAAN